MTLDTETHLHPAKITLASFLAADISQSRKRQQSHDVMSCGDRRVTAE